MSCTQYECRGNPFPCSAGGDWQHPSLAENEVLKTRKRIRRLDRLSNPPCTDFLPFYNQSVINLRERLGFFPAPTFSFEFWLGGLIGAIILGYSLTPFVYRGGKVIRVVSVVLGILMVGNALGHLLGSVYLGMVLPGMWSSPFLLVAALFVIIQSLRGNWQIKHELMEGDT